MPAQPFLFAGAEFGSMLFLRLFGTQRLARLIAALIILAGTGIIRSPAYFKAANLARRRSFLEMKSFIPPNASLLAQQCLFPHFDTRRTIQIFPVGNSFPGLKTMYLMNPEFAVCDRIGNALPFNEVFLAKAIASWEADPRYKKIFEKDNLIVFQRLNKEAPRWEARLQPTN
jgi:uncharacterized membrane protein